MALSFIRSLTRLSPTCGNGFLPRAFSTAPPKTRDQNDGVYDVLILGGGVTGTSLLYELSMFTNLKRLALVERRSGYSLVQSHPRNNSQTIHCGDIETNYTLEKACLVKKQADMLRNFASKLPPAERDTVVQKMPKMALAVGETECEFMEKRFEIFRDNFKSIQLIGKNEICELEPRVGMMNSHEKRPDKIVALNVPNEYTAVNYLTLSKSFVDQALSVKNKTVDIALNTEVTDIHREAKDLFSVITTSGVKKARFVVVSGCGHSLLMAQRMGYGLQYSCLPMAGSFYFAPCVLNGKVYCVQDPRLPFAAVHGDPDMFAKGMTRFGPTALPLPLLERYNLSTFTDYLKVINPDLDLMRVYMNLLNTNYMRNYVLRNFLFEVPFLNVRLFANDVRKIVPSMKTEELTYAKGFGGVRPQLIDKKQRKLLLGEGKILTGENIIFNITPSPGGTTCLGTGASDMREICESLGASIDEGLFKKTLLEGEYPVHD